VSVERLFGRTCETGSESQTMIFIRADESASKILANKKKHQCSPRLFAARCVILSAVKSIWNQVEPRFFRSHPSTRAGSSKNKWPRALAIGNRWLVWSGSRNGATGGKFRRRWWRVFDDFSAAVPSKNASPSSSEASSKFQSPWKNGGSKIIFLGWLLLASGAWILAASHPPSDFLVWVLDYS